MKFEKNFIPAFESDVEKRWLSNRHFLDRAIKASRNYGLLSLVILTISYFWLYAFPQGGISTFIQAINNLACDFAGSALFALAVGNYALQASRVDPKEAPLEERISTLFNNTIISDGAKKHLRDYVGDFATYSPSYELVLEYTSYNSEFKYYDVVVRATRILISSLRKETTRVTLPIEIYTDEVPGYSGPRAQFISNIIESGNVSEDTVQLPILIYEDHFRLSRTYTIAPAEKLTIRQKYSLLHADGTSYRCLPQKYTDILSVRVANLTPSDLRIYDITKDIEISVSPGHAYTYAYTEQGPEEKELFRTLP